MSNLQSDANVEKMTVKEKIFNLGQRLGKAILLPIAILPVAGLLLGISAALSNGATVRAYPFLNQGMFQGILKIMNAAGNGIFSALTLLFAVGIAVGLAKNDKGTAGLAAVAGFFVMNSTINALLAVTGTLASSGTDLRLYGQGNILGTVTLQTGVFGGILIGILAGWLHNKYYKKELPIYLAFFGGSRFVPIVTAIGAMALGSVLFLVWPFFGKGIASLGALVNRTGLFGPFIYGIIQRSLLPLGLHHVFYLPFWTTALGGTAEVGGKVYEGFQTIFLAQLGDPQTVKFFGNLAKFNSGRYLHMMFGLPAICLAMYHAIPDEKRRKATIGFLLSAALTSFITGVTEPIDFALFFASPVLFFVSAVFFALNYVITTLLGVTIGSTFSAGIIEFFLFGVMQGNAKTEFIWILILAIPSALTYYFTFKTLIVKFNYGTPGREKDEGDLNIGTEPSHIANAEPQLAGDTREATIITGLGGKENISDLDNCATRLRVTVKEPAKVDQKILKSTGAHAVLVRGKSIQVIYGPAVNIIRVKIDEYLAKL